MMNKPCGYVCSAVSDSHKTVYQLLPQELQQLVQGAKRGERLHTVGRLDCDTRGLLLFTNDGMFSHTITATSIPKNYLVKLQKPVPLQLQNQYITRASQGLLLPTEKKYSEQKSAPAELSFINETTCYIKIKEGKFHEVKRIFRALENEVLELKRISIGNLYLPENLQQGEYRNLTLQEINLAKFVSV